MTAYELSAKIDFKDVSSFTNALRRMRIEANKGTKSVADMARAIDKLNSSTNKLQKQTNTANKSIADQVKAADKARGSIEKADAARRKSIDNQVRDADRARTLYERNTDAQVRNADRAKSAIERADAAHRKSIDNQVRNADRARTAYRKSIDSQVRDADRARTAYRRTVDAQVRNADRARTTYDKQNRAAADAADETERLRRRYSGAAGSLNRFTDSLHANASANSLFLKALGLSYRDISKFNKIIALASNKLALFAFGISVATIGVIKGAIALGTYSRSLASLAAIGNTSTTSVQGILNAIRPLNGTILEAGNAVEEFNERLGDLTATGSGPAKQAYALLGVAVRDVNGNLRNTDAVLADTIKSLRNVKNAAQQSALVVQLFGEQAGPILAASLRENASAFDVMADSGKTAANVLSQDVVKGANAAFTAMQEAVNTIRISFFDSVSKLSTRLEDFGNLLVKLTPTVKLFGEIFSSIADKILFLVNGLINVYVAGQDLIVWLNELIPLWRYALEGMDALADSAGRLKDALHNVSAEGPVELALRDDGQSIEDALASIKHSPNGTNAPGVLGFAERLKSLLSQSDDIEKALQTTYSKTNQLRIEGIDDVIVREKILAKIQEQANAKELDRLSELEVDPTKKFEAVIAFNNLEIAQQEKIARLEKARNESNKERINLFESSLRGELLSQNVQNSDGSTLKAFEERKSALNEYLQYQIEKEYEALDKLLIETKASNSKRLELERQLGQKISSDRLALSKQIADEELEIEKKLIDEKRSLSNILQRQDNNLFAGSKDKEAGFIKQAEYQRESLKRQIEQDREALNIQLENFERHESEKAAIRATFEAEAAQRQSNLNIKLEADSRAAMKTLLEPATGFFEELAVGYAKSKTDGEQSWKAVRDAAVKNLQEILLQQIINQGIQSALSFGLGLFGGAAGAATGGIGAISPAGAQGGGVTSFPTTNNSAPLFNASTRSMPQNDYISADVKVEINGNNQNPAEVEAAALAGAEKALNSIVDKRIAYQTKTSGLIGRSRR